jgi:AcrR family transcriptional regulator
MRVYDGMTAEERIGQRRQRILDAALELFIVDGYSSTSIRAILRKSGLPDRYFSESFTSLDHVMATIMRNVYDEEERICREVVENANTRREKAYAMVDALTGLTLSDPRWNRIKMFESHAAGALTAGEIQEGLVRISQIVASLFGPEGVDSHLDEGLLSLGIVGAVGQMLDKWVQDGFTMPREQVTWQGVYLFEAVAEFRVGP